MSCFGVRWRIPVLKDPLYLVIESLFCHVDARTMGAPFVTGDKRLFNAMKDKMQSVIWIEQLQVHSD